MDNLNVLLSVIGLLAGIVFVWLNKKTSKSLLGSFFKKYYMYLLMASVAFALGWIPEILAYFSIMSPEDADSYHHILLLIASIVFVGAAYYMPKEAAQYMKVCESKKSV